MTEHQVISTEGEDGSMRTTRHVVIATAVVLLAISSACGRDREGGGSGGGDRPKPPPGGLTVAQALESEVGPIRVKGAVVARGDDIRLCDTLAESFPPQCGGANLRLVGFDVDMAEGVQQEGTVRWAENVSVVGTREGNTLTVDDRRR